MLPPSIAHKVRLAAKRKMKSEAKEAKARAEIRARMEEQDAVQDPVLSLQIGQEEGGEVSQPPQATFGTTLSDLRSKVPATESLPSLGSISDRGFEQFQTEETSTAAVMPEKTILPSTEIVDLDSGNTEVPATTPEVEAEIASVEKTIADLTDEILEAEDQIQQRAEAEKEDAMIAEEPAEARAEEERSITPSTSDVLLEEDLGADRQERNEETALPSVPEEDEEMADASAPTVAEAQESVIPNPPEDPDTTLALTLTQEGLPSSSATRAESTNEAILATLRSMDQSMRAMNQSMSELSVRVRNIEEFIASRGETINPMAETVEKANFRMGVRHSYGMLVGRGLVDPDAVCNDRVANSLLWVMRQ